MNSSEFVSNFIFLGSSITKCNISNDFTFYDEKENYQKNLSVSHHIDSIEFLEDKEAILGIITLNIKNTFSKDDQNVSFDVSMQGGFAIDEQKDNTNLDTFREYLTVNGLTTLYSLLRGFISSTSSQIFQTGKILLPMFNIAQYSKESSENSPNNNSNA